MAKQERIFFLYQGLMRPWIPCQEPVVFHPRFGQSFDLASDTKRKLLSVLLLTYLSSSRFNLGYVMCPSLFNEGWSGCLETNIGVPCWSTFMMLLCFLPAASSGPFSEGGTEGQAREMSFLQTASTIPGACSFRRWCLYRPKEDHCCG